MEYKRGELSNALNIFEWLNKNYPKDATVIANKISVLKDIGKNQEARKFVDALNHSEKTNSLVRGANAYLLIGEKRIDEAILELKELCKLEPRKSLHWLNLSACYRILKYNIAASEIIKQGLIIEPLDKELKLALSQCMAELGKGKVAIKLIKELTTKEGLSTSQLFAIQFFGEGYKLVKSKELREAAKFWEQKKVRDGISTLWADRIRNRSRKEALRIGYLSADFCNHPVGRFMLPIFENKNEETIKIISLSCGDFVDEVTKKLKVCCDEWYDLKEMNDLEAARYISNLKLDVLVELGGYTGNSRIGILCYRPTKIQLSYLGYFAPTYLDCIDGWIGDRELFGGLTKIQKEAHKLIQIEGGYMAYNEYFKIEIERTEDKRFRFGCFNHSRKLTESTIKLFVSILKTAKESLLVLKSVSFVEEKERIRIKKIFEKNGIENNRLIILPWISGRDNHLKKYKEVDVALDPLPYGGATTTCEALGMGVPVITIRGEGMIGRLSSSILKSGGCSEWIANTQEEYKNIAIALAKQGFNDRDQRMQLRKKVLKSKLTDGKRLSDELERVYREAANISINDCSR